MSEQIKVSGVFVPGRLPDYTYNPRAELQLEGRLADYVDEGGSILTVAGPTKTGKSVLLRRVVDKPVWIDGQGISSVDEMWLRVGDHLGAFTGIEVGSSSGTDATTGARAEFGIPGTGNLAVNVNKGTAGGSSRLLSLQRPVSTAAREKLESTQRPLVIDDFHFIDRPVQRQIVRALKPLVLAGVPVVLVAISHRVQDVVTAEPDMTGRVSHLSVKFWSEDELLVIPRKGFHILNVVDNGERLARHLAENSFGSPHLMQKFCRELCKSQGVREQQNEVRELIEPDDWPKFFADQVDGASADWFQRLLRGPQERGSERTQWKTVDHGSLDGYGLTLAAIARTGPKLSMTKDEIKAAVERETVLAAPAAHQTTRVLQHMTRIASKRVSATPPSEAELDAPEDPDSVSDLQPVLEYLEDGPNSTLHIADPFFAFYLRWGSATHLLENASR